MAKTLKMGPVTLGPGHPTFIIAEAGVNHNGDPKIAVALIDAAADAGADAVKFQTFVASELVSAQAPKAEYQMQTTNPDESQLAMLRKLEISEAMHLQLMEHAQNKGIMLISTPFHESSADLLARLKMPLLKIPSGEVTNWPFLAHVARIGLPIILSTGMANLGEVAEAVDLIRREGDPPLALLHCVSNYPADPATVNLRAMATMSQAFDVPIGYSDHTPGIEVPLAAVALGARIIEKHFTLDRNMEGPDHRASLEPDELTAMVSGIRTVEAALGDGRKHPAEPELATADIARKSLVAAGPIAKGSRLTREMISLKRPGTGLHARFIPLLLNRVATADIPADGLLSTDMFE